MVTCCWRVVAEGASPTQVNKSASVFGAESVIPACRRRSDEGGIQRAGVLSPAGSGLKQLLYQGGFLLLQLGDALTLLRHLLRTGRGNNERWLLSVCVCRMWSELHLCEEPVLILQSLDGLGRSWTWSLGVS